MVHVDQGCAVTGTDTDNTISGDGCLWCTHKHTHTHVRPSVGNGIVAAVFCVVRGRLTPTPDRD